MSCFKILIILLIFYGECYAQLPLFKYNPPGCVNGPTIIDDILSRCDEGDKSRAYDSNEETMCHELTHQLNSKIRNMNGGTGNFNAVYLGNGYAWVMKEPNVTLADVAVLVKPEYRDGPYNLYLIQQQKYWNNEPLYVLDEWISYYNGALLAKQKGFKSHGSVERAQYFTHYAECLKLAIEIKDPNWPDREALENLIIWQKDRLNSLIGNP